MLDLCRWWHPIVVVARTTNDFVGEACAGEPVVIFDPVRRKAAGLPGMTRSRSHVTTAPEVL